MRVPRVGGLPISRLVLLFSLVAILCLAPSIWGQGTYMAQLRGVVRDKSGAVVAGAKLVLTEDATNVSHPATTDGAGQYIYVSLRPSTYSLRVDAAGFEPTLNRGITLQEGQKAELDFSLNPAVSTTTVEVVDTVPLLDVGSASLGTDVTTDFIINMPIGGRDISQLVYMSAGLTPLDNAPGNYPTGTSFMANGQRYGSAEFRLDGVLATGPEQGEGSNSNLSYNPSVETVQEFKVQLNSFSAEYGSSGGTVINMVMKSGTNKFHGSVYEFGQRRDLNANGFYNNLYGTPRTGGTNDQYGFSLTGPIFKGKTFFLVDLEKVKSISGFLETGRVPTARELGGDFSQTLVPDVNGNPQFVQIFNPFAPLDKNGDRVPFPNNVIPTAMIQNANDQSPAGPIGVNLANAYPTATSPLNIGTWTNYSHALVVRAPTTQFDIKIDHELSNTMHLMGRYSQNDTDYNPPGSFYQGETSHTVTRNVALEYTWTVSPRLLWTSRIGLDRYHELTKSTPVNLDALGLPPLLKNANNLTRMPWVDVGDYRSLAGPNCCNDTINGHTQIMYSSSISWVHGKHAVKFGGEQRPFFNNFWQPNYPTGYFDFSNSITARVPISDPVLQDGNGLASMLLGFPLSGYVNAMRAPANKSNQTDFYIQDDWKATSRLTLNFGLRYEWSIPYTERHNLVQFSDFTADSGVNINLSASNPSGPSTQSVLQSFGSGVSIPSTEEVYGTTVFPTSSHRRIPADLTNWGPRLGFAYQIEKDTVVRGGAGVFYGMTNHTNWQYPSPAFETNAIMHFTNDGGVTQNLPVTLSNPFPGSSEVPPPQGTKYGSFADWGYGDANMEGMAADRNPRIIQWNLGVQHMLPMGVMFSADYSANRSTRLPWGYVQDYQDTIPDKLREQLVNAAPPATVNNPSPVSTLLESTQVANPFLSMFQGPGAVFNEPNSRYSSPTLPLNNLLNPYPQFDGAGGFTGQPLLKASSWYNGLLVSFQKRPTHGLSFIGSYTWSKATDSSSYGSNNWIYFGGNGQGTPQDTYNLKAEHSISANDTPQRFTLATTYVLPFGRKHWLGGDMNRVLDAFVGGWEFTPVLTFASGQPIAIADGFGGSSGRLAEGQQRPNINCSHPLSGLTMHQVAVQSLTNPNANYFNLSCFSDPGDQVPGNAPRFSGNARGEGLKNLNIGFRKEFTIKEGMRLEVRSEFFNFTNSTRFYPPPAFYGSSGFGSVNEGNGQLNSPRYGQVAVRFEF